MKINKIYPAFYNGITQQPPELSLDNQCPDMVNCLPDLIKGLKKRAGVNYITHKTTLPSTSKIIHTYDRGEDDEEYIFVYVGGDNPIQIFDKTGVEKTVNIEPGEETDIRAYLNTSTVKGLTVQDRTWLTNTSKEVYIDTTGYSALDVNYDKRAFYWLKRASGDRYNPYNYAVYLNGITVSVNPDKPSMDTKDPVTGAEDSDFAATVLTDRINGTNDSGWNPSLFYVIGFTCVRSGSMLKIYKNDGSDFTFDSWDSWGNQASEGWKGSVNKITDLPNDFSWVDTYVEIIGDDNDRFTAYYVKWNGTSWEETQDPSLVRGELKNMPIACERQGDGTFKLFKLIWQRPKVGNEESNPDPSFIGYTINDLFFYKNRFGCASTDSIVLSETAGYENFYIKTALDITDTDPIDVAIASSKASKIYFAKPFNNSLFIFTKDTQFQLVSDGFLSPATVSIDTVTNYPMAIDVEPKVINNSLFFISTTGGRQQLREYIRDEKLSVTGVDLNITTPTLLTETIKSIQVNGVLGYVLLCTDNNLVYLYAYKDSGTERVQSSWSKWELLQGLSATANSFEYGMLDSTFIIVCKTADAYIYHTMELTELDGSKEDVSYNGTYPFTASILMPQWYPHVSKVGTPKDKILLKKCIIQGTGAFDAVLYRRDYNVSYTKQNQYGLADLDFHINSKVGNCDITIQDSTSDDFTITSVILEGMYQPTSREMR